MSVETGPFVWEEVPVTERSSADCRQFRLRDEAMRNAVGHWVLKQYSPRPTPDTPFSGWRLVSGGPIGPGYKTPLECAQSALRYFRKAIPEWIKLAEAKRDEATRRVETLQSVLAMTKRRKAS